MQKSKLKDCKACGKEISPLSPFCRQCEADRAFKPLYNSGAMKQK